MGPGAGVHGGHLVAQGTPEQVMRNPASLTGRYSRASSKFRRRAAAANSAACSPSRVRVRTICANSPSASRSGVFICITGVSGSGKSSLVLDTLYRALAQKLNRSRERAGAHKSIEGVERLDKVIDVDQSPIGRTPRSNPATYTGLFTHIRELFAQLPEARMRGYGPGRFSASTSRADAARRARATASSHRDALPARRLRNLRSLRRQTLQPRNAGIQYKGKNIAEVLDMTVRRRGASSSGTVPRFAQNSRRCGTSGLDYIHLGQSATTLSGGEAQRIKLAKELARRATGRTLYILDEPTTGLHFDDIKRLLERARIDWSTPATRSS